MHRNVSRLLDLINELMDFRKAETGALKLKVMPGNLHLLLQEIEEEFIELAHEKKIQFDVLLQENIGKVWFDLQVLEKIIVNLVSNSFKYTADQGAISVQVLPSLENFKPSFTNELLIKNRYQAKRYIYLKVADNGIGISKASIQHLFERYYRITEAHMGSGIGLAFVKSLTLLHKGNIQVYSERIKGTEIIIALPVDKEDYAKGEKWINSPEADVRLEDIQYKYEHPEAEKRVPESKEDANSHSLKPRILIVDDNAELRDFVKTVCNYILSYWKQKMEWMACKKQRNIFLT